MFRTLQTQSNGHRRLLSSRISKLNPLSSLKSIQSRTTHSSISYYNQLIHKQSITYLQSTTSPFKSLINRLNTSSLNNFSRRNNSNLSLLQSMHQWMPTIKHHHHTLPPLSQLHHILFNASKTPRGFGQFTKKTKSSKKEGSSSTANEQTSSKPTESASKSSQSSSKSSTDPKPKTETKTIKEGMKISNG